jgi:hypothetical protein
VLEADTKTPSKGKILDASKGTPFKDKVPQKNKGKAQLRKRCHPTTMVAPPRGRWMEGGATFAKTKVIKIAKSRDHF